jgi:hypothetical protein
MNSSTEYYLLDDHHYVHGVWVLPSVDGTKIIFNNLESMKKYCKSIKDKWFKFYNWKWLFCWFYNLEN